jgi:hypothetical protein
MRSGNESGASISLDENAPSREDPWRMIEVLFFLNARKANDV